MSFAKQVQQQLLEIAHDSIEQCTRGKKPSPISNHLDPSILAEDGSGVFVTLYLKGRLRGCIGLMESNLSLAATVQKMAIASSLDDPRFKPVEPDEIKNISIEISVLSPKRLVTDISEIELGKDGIIVSGYGHQGVFLPQVATEAGWDLNTFLSTCCEQKAGLAPQAWQEAEVDVFAFRSEIIKEK